MNLPKPQLRLSTLLVLMLLIGVMFAWYADHRRQVARQQKLETQTKMQGEQIAILQKQAARQGASAGIFYYWASADQFIASLKQAEDENFLQMAPSFSRADGPAFKAGIEQVIELLGSDVLQEKKRAITAISFMLQANKERMVPFGEAAVARLTPLLRDPDSGVQGETIGVLGRFGPQAKGALPELKKIMLDDKDHWAAFSARSVALIEPSEDIGPRLIELIERKHRGWYTAAVELPQHVSAEVARKVISKRYEAAENDVERNMAVHALNRVGVEKE